MNQRFPDSNMQSVYLIGICGTAMASLAGMLRETGTRVSGSDANVYPPMSSYLDQLGIPVFQGFSEENVKKAQPDLVVIGNALSRGNPEVEYVLDSRTRYASMAEVLRERFIRGKNSVVIAGTHGKTTTTAMLAWMLQAAGRRPSFLVGGIAENFGRSFQVADGPEFVIEGDEYDTAFFDKGPKFLHYLPWLVVLNNIEYDHADIYPDLESVKVSFRRLINIVPRSGLIVAGGDCPVVRELIPAAFSRVQTFGTGDADWRATEIRVETQGTSFEIRRGAESVGRFEIAMAGEFNVRNALGAVAAASELGISRTLIAESLRTFKGVKRRLEVRGAVRGITVYDDFAHHPTAVFETLRGLRARVNGARIWAVFEPRSQTCRRRVFEERFIESFDPADTVVIAQVYGPSRLAPDQLLDPSRVVEGVRRRGKAAHALPSADRIVDLLANEARDGDQIVIMSNGGFDNIHQKLLDRLKGSAT